MEGRLLGLGFEGSLPVGSKALGEESEDFVEAFDNFDVIDTASSEVSGKLAPVPKKSSFDCVRDPWRDDLPDPDDLLALDTRAEADCEAPLWEALPKKSSRASSPEAPCRES